jgi:hypothetical protein
VDVKLEPVMKSQTSLCVFYYGIISGSQVYVATYAESIIIINIKYNII